MLFKFIAQEKKRLPKFVFRFNYCVLLPSFLVFLIVVAAAAVTSQVLESKGASDLVSAVPLMVMCGALVAYCAVIIPCAFGVRRKLIALRVSELEKKYFPLEGEQTLSALKESGITDGESFLPVAENDNGELEPFEGEPLPIDKVKTIFQAAMISTELCMGVFVYTDENDDDYYYDLTNEMYNFMRERKQRIDNPAAFELFETDKPAFVKMMMGIGFKADKVEPRAKKLLEKRLTKADR